MDGSLKDTTPHQFPYEQTMFDWNRLSLRDIRSNPAIREMIQNPAVHAGVVFNGLQSLYGLSTPEDIARRLAILQEINVVEPDLIGGDPAVLEQRRFQEIRLEPAKGQRIFRQCP